MLVSAKEMLEKAVAGHYAVGQFNINNLEWTKAILTAAEETKSPVILGVSEGAGKYMTGFKTVQDMVAAMVEEMGITVPVATVPTTDVRNVSRQGSHPLCSTDLSTRSKRMLPRQKN